MNPGERQTVLDRARQGDAQALGTLLESYRPYVRVMVRAFEDRRLQARLGESDLIQDALLEAHRSFAAFQGTTVAELAAWLRQVVLRAAGHTRREHLATARRDAGREQPTETLDEVADPGSTPSDHAIRHEQAAQIAAALARLPEDMQHVLLGRHMDGLSHAAIAEQLGRTPAAVRVLYVRALRRLRELCQEY
jgi:RNA polymerase sigma-70 factor (ECF subfamily)